jgi:hypothetical protein
VKPCKVPRHRETLKDEAQHLQLANVQPAFARKMPSFGRRRLPLIKVRTKRRLRQTL